MKKEDDSMFKIAALGACILFIFVITFLVIPSALSFEDYITSETTIQEEAAEPAPEEEMAVEREQAPVMGGSDVYYEEVRDELETFGKEDTIEQVELQETEELKYEEELER